MYDLLKKLNKHYHKSMKFRLGRLGFEISGDDALFVWQFVRFSERYQNLYNIHKEDMNTELDWELFAKMFGMSEAVDFENSTLPDGFYFYQRMVKEFDIRRFYEDEIYFKEIKNYLCHRLPVKLSLDPNPVDKAFAFVVNLEDDPASIGKIIEREMEKRRKNYVIPKESNVQRACSAMENLSDYLISYYFREIEEKSLGITADKLDSITGFEKEKTQIKRNIINFKKLSEVSPYTFFLPLK